MVPSIGRIVIFAEVENKGTAKKPDLVVARERPAVVVGVNGDYCDLSIFQSRDTDLELILDVPHDEVGETGHFPEYWHWPVMV